MSKISQIRKAIVGAVLAGGPLALAALHEASPGGDGITQAELVAVLVTALVAGAGVYSVPNEPTA